jgi:hypothetical protein
LDIDAAHLSVRRRLPLLWPLGSVKAAAAAGLSGILSYADAAASGSAAVEPLVAMAAEVGFSDAAAVGRRAITSRGVEAVEGLAWLADAVSAGRLSPGDGFQIAYAVGFSGYRARGSLATGSFAGSVADQAMLAADRLAAGPVLSPTGAASASNPHAVYVPLAHEQASSYGVPAPSGAEIRRSIYNAFADTFKGIVGTGWNAISTTANVGGKTTGAAVNLAGQVGGVVADTALVGGVTLNSAAKLAAAGRQFNKQVGDTTAMLLENLLASVSAESREYEGFVVGQLRVDARDVSIGMHAFSCKDLAATVADGSPGYVEMQDACSAEGPAPVDGATIYHTRAIIKHEKQLSLASYGLHRPKGMFLGRDPSGMQWASIGELHAGLYYHDAGGHSSGFHDDGPAVAPAPSGGRASFASLPADYALFNPPAMLSASVRDDNIAYATTSVPRVALSALKLIANGPEVTLDKDGRRVRIDFDVQNPTGTHPGVTLIDVSDASIQGRRVLRKVTRTSLYVVPHGQRGEHMCVAVLTTIDNTGSLIRNTGLSNADVAAFNSGYKCPGLIVYESGGSMARPTFNAMAAASPTAHQHAQHPAAGRASLTPAGLAEATRARNAHLDRVGEFFQNAGSVFGGRAATGEL